MQPTRWHHCKWQHSPANHNGDDSGPDGDGDGDGPDGDGDGDGYGDGPDGDDDGDVDGDGDGDGPDGEDNKEDKTRQIQESQELNFQFPFLTHLSLSSITITRNI